ncbi:beta-glucosidase BglX [Larsenimonas suaedae]|uniref:beta-glucosidase n=1 Tax=Larsenimonas suaedae TaxID=1851019 RepID=A0ABU1GRI6_9GAMM|nr:beta-glucosidase BglX [Larsenimonas suaedae]MCM2972571.1 beta-glucosidase BglX [Larsenimonas suaedae]MDR5894633.1 beta-glucosidase BglX [Larsenimonas suaedae]
MSAQGTKQTVGQPFGLDTAQGRALDEMVETLLAQMTLEEKIGQMNQVAGSRDTTGAPANTDIEDDVRQGRVGSVFNAFGVEFTRELQTQAVAHSRLGIPLLFGYDIIHGFKTIFPIPLAQAASWHLEGIERAARVMAREGAASGVHWTFAPMVDVARDPRWGRVMEGAGEDTHLTSQIARAQVRGIQGRAPGATDTLAACVKHYAAYGAVEAGREYNTVDLSEWRLRSIYLPPFLAALEEGCASVMTAFNTLNAIPATCHPLLLDQILRREWGFKGMVVTDYTAIMELERHGVAEDALEASRKAVNAGVDMDMQSGYFIKTLEELVRCGAVEEARIDEAVRRILWLKAALGLFEDPYRYADDEREAECLLSDAHRRAAREQATESMVLLKNEGNVLPLSDQHKKIALIGPLGNTPRLIGSWHGNGDHDDTVTLRDGIAQRLGNGATIMCADGVSNQIGDTDTSGIEAALELVRQADAVILALGEDEAFADEAASRTDIGLPGMQLELARRVLEAAGDTPVATVLFNGRPLTLTELDGMAPAILEAWWPGTEAGNAVADVLFGDVTPAGKLPMSFPRHVGQIPVYYNAFNTGRPKGVDPKYASKYLDSPNDSLYPFGFGLSYTTFEYSALKASCSEIGMNDTLEVSLTVTNTGKRQGIEVVQLYLQDVSASVVRPVRELKDFRRIELAPGACAHVRFHITPEMRSFLNAELETVQEPGRFHVQIGGDSTQGKPLEFHVTPHCA